jgi:stage II sporulation protein D
MKKLFMLLFGCFSIALASADVIFFHPESSVPAPGMPYEAEIDKNIYRHIRVKVFPHTLLNDGTHGVPDNAQTVSLVGKNLSMLGHSVQRLNITTRGNRLLVTAENGVNFQLERGFIKSPSPIQVVRKNNSDKTHSYLGFLEVFLKEGKIHLVNHVDIETYLKGVVPKEVISTWPLEALKAQAVAARSYAYYHLLTAKGKDYDVDDTIRFQVYAGYSIQTPATNLAIDQTQHQVLKHRGKVIAAFFHAYSGGRTDDAGNIFPNPVAFCLGKEEIFSREELKQELPPRAHWIVEWTTKWQTKAEMLAKFQSKHTQFRNFTTDTNYQVEEEEFNEFFDTVKTLRFNQGPLEARMHFVSVRSTLGWSVLPSYHYRVLTNGQDEIAFTGSGWGHHVGMSQWGAFIMAKNYGKSYAEILHHYYSNVELGPL